MNQKKQEMESNYLSPQAKNICLYQARPTPKFNENHIHVSSGKNKLLSNQSSGKFTIKVNKATLAFDNSRSVCSDVPSLKLPEKDSIFSSQQTRRSTFAN
jgi:hypothetical protein